MGRNPKTDAQKIAEGTYKDSRSEQARKTAAVSNVLAFPVETSIPKCKFPLPENGAGMQTYNDYCQRLLKAGLLTKVSLEFVTTLAITDHKIEAAFKAGKAPASRDLIVKNSIASKLDMLNVDQDVVTGQTKKGVFGKNGFPARLRLSAAHHARRPK
jgi:hypothetical protein